MTKPITKAELVTHIATHGNMSKAQAAMALDAVIETINNQLVAGNAVALPGLAKFETRERPAREVRNIATGEMIDKASDRTVKISALTAIKTAVNASPNT